MVGMNSKAVGRRDVLRFVGAAAGAVVGAKAGFGAVAEHAVAAAPAPLKTAPALQGVYFNQLGFLPERAKVASLVGAAGDAFRVRVDGSSEVVFSGKLGATVADEASGDSVRVADFSALTKVGVYRIEVGGAVSEPFTVREDAYASALRTSMRGFTGQRCGCAVDLGDGYKHAACHLTGAFHASTGKSGTEASRFGWHDAGDYGRYVVNSGITCGTLLWAWEMYPKALDRLLLGIPETGKGTPDYLAEVRWNLEWMLTMQDADGGVFHKQTSEGFCGFIMPEKDTLVSYVIGTGKEPYKSTCATADFAAVMAIAGRCYKRYDAGFADRCLSAARKAWTWAVTYPTVTFENPPGISTGGYGDKDCSDELLWASAELFRTTGEARYEQQYMDGIAGELAGSSLKVDAPSWGGVRSMALWTYWMGEQSGTGLMREGNGSVGVKVKILEGTVKAAEGLKTRAAANGYGNTMGAHDYVWGSNAVAANQSLLLLVAERMSPGKGYGETALGNLHYLIGRNCLGVSWVTQVGTRPFLHPHHRPSAADGIEKPWPGLLSGGPNAWGGDKVADAMEKRPAMRMWVDDERAYSMNEIAINWNAPLVFLLAAANAG
jgi:endoglucanase